MKTKVMKKYTAKQLNEMREIKPQTVIIIGCILIAAFFFVIWLLIGLIKLIGWKVFVGFLVGLFASALVWSVYKTFKDIYDEKYEELDIDNVYPKKK